MDAERGLEARGFVVVDGSQSPSGFSNRQMYNRQTGQCVQLETAEGKVMTINAVTHPKCRWAPARPASSACCARARPLLGKTRACGCSRQPE
jgi:hypothetical protein